MTGRLFFFLAGFTLLASDWPEWRGPHRDGGVSEEPKDWPEKPTLKWKIDVGMGQASPIMGGGTMYEFPRQGEKETVLAIDPSNGAIRWTQQYTAPYKVNSAA